MLEPQDRYSLLESLRPPQGYQLDRAIGTTFSLDLVALAIAPLAFVLFDWEDDKGKVGGDVLAVLEALRRYADRTSIFCQAGEIKVPPQYRPLIQMLEDSVVEVTPSNRHGVFHPKVWVLRFVSPGCPVRYRMLCLSRNLTFDRSWDTVLVLEGDVVDRQRAFGESNPIGDFVAALPELAIRPVSDRIKTDISDIQSEIRRVRFAPPDGFEQVRFCPLGIKGYSRWPFEDRVDRMLVISPFLSSGCLKKLTEQGGGHLLVSRMESLADMPAERFKQVFILNEMAVGEVDEDSVDKSLSGLHAKLYIADAGWDARLWTGSANATDAAFKNNIEFLVEMTGKKSRFGIDAVLSRKKGQTTLLDLLQEVDASSEYPEVDLEKAELERVAGQVRRTIAGASLVAEVDQSGKDIYDIRLAREDMRPLSLPQDISVRCWPITVAPTASVLLQTEGDVWVEFYGLSYEAVTSFFAVELIVSKGNKNFTSRFVLNLPLHNPPLNRRENLLRSLLTNQKSLMKFLLFLLAEDGMDARRLLAEVGRESKNGNGAAAPGFGLPLFEVMLRALDRDPAKLDHIARLVEDLEKTPDGRKLLPDGFDDIWRPIWETRNWVKK